VVHATTCCPFQLMMWTSKVYFCNFSMFVERNREYNIIIRSHILSMVGQSLWMQNGPNLVCIYSNSALIRFINCSAIIGFLMKQPILLSGCTSLAASIFISPAVIKQTLTLRSLRTKFWAN
jgi:hypothetical protein